MPDPNRDDDALTWDGDADLDTPARRPRKTRGADSGYEGNTSDTATTEQEHAGDDSEGEESESTELEDAEPDEVGPDSGESADADAEERSQPSRALTFLFAAIALAAAVGWVVVSIWNPVQQPSLLGLAMYQLGELLSIVAAPLWWYTARALAKRPLPWWIAGAAVTAPWPLLVSALAGGAA